MAHISLQLLNVDSSGNNQWIQFWNESNNIQDGNDDWRSTGKIYIPSSTESYIRFEAKMYGGGTTISIDDLNFGKLQFCW